MGNALAVEVTIAELERFEDQGRPVLAAAASIEVVDVASQELAASTVCEIDGQIKEIKEAFADPKKLADRAHKSICALESKCLGEREQVKRTIKGKIGAWQAEQEQIRHAVQAKRQLEARKLADDEALERAATLEADGRKEEAEAVLDAPIAPPLMPAPPPPPKPEGVTTRVYWKHEVIDAKQIPFDYMKPDDIKLAGYARSMRDTASVPGVRFYSERY